jgi:DNA-directed RNA polymerase specialized sigma54-like protein
MLKVMNYIVDLQSDFREGRSTLPHTLREVAEVISSNESTVAV